MVGCNHFREVKKDYVLIKKRFPRTKYSSLQGKKAFFGSTTQGWNELPEIGYLRLENENYQ